MKVAIKRINQMCRFSVHQKHQAQDYHAFDSMHAFRIQENEK